MPISDEVKYASPKDLYLDRKNPRLGRALILENLSQDRLLRVMRDWELEELAVSFVENGFWTQEPLVVVMDEVSGTERPVVVEGNRRLAALKLLLRAVDGAEESDVWKKIAKSASAQSLKRLAKVPYVLADARKDVEAYLGFRHVSGIKEWEPAEKAQFIAHLIDDRGMTYEEVRRRIGSKVPAVRQNYISYRVLLEMEDSDAIDLERVEERFSVLYLSLRTEGVQKYLHVDIQADPAMARRPVPKNRMQELANFALWLFGRKNVDPIVDDSRDTDRFGAVLLSRKAVEYLERSEKPTLDVAYRIAGGDEAETANNVEVAADRVELALGTAHHHVASTRLAGAVRRLALDTVQLIELFPAIKTDIKKKL